MWHKIIKCYSNITLTFYNYINVFHMFISRFLIHIRMWTRSRTLKKQPNAYKTAFELQHEDGHIKKPKHIANLINFKLYFI